MDELVANRYNDIVDDVKAIVDKATITRNKKKNGKNYVAIKRNHKD